MKVNEGERSIGALAGIPEAFQLVDSTLFCGEKKLGIPVRLPRRIGSIGVRIRVRPNFPFLRFTSGYPNPFPRSPRLGDRTIADCN
jgi:hypothetical protein